MGVVLVDKGSSDPLASPRQGLCIEGKRIALYYVLCGKLNCVAVV